MHRVAIVACDEVVPFDLTTPAAVFECVRLTAGAPGYRVRVCGTADEVDVRVDPDVLYVDEGQILTSAGAAAAFDLCLHLVRRDYGAAVALDAARRSVMPLERDGGQSQFIVQPAPAPDGASLAPVLDWLLANLEQPLRLDRIARRAGMSVRTLNRRFREQVGTTPLRWLLQARVRRAQLLLETTQHAVERIAGEVGFGSVTAFRSTFRREVGTPPQSYRRAFRSRAHTHPPGRRRG